MDPLEDWSVRPKYVPPTSDPVAIDPPARLVTVRLRRSYFDELARLALARGCSRQDIVREAVEIYLDTEPRT